MTWRRSGDITLFKDRKTRIRSIAQSTAIRANGHAWCTADDNLCVGSGTLDDMRYTTCENAVSSIVGRNGTTMRTTRLG